MSPGCGTAARGWGLLAAAAQRGVRPSAPPPALFLAPPLQLRPYAKSAEERLGLEKPKRPVTGYVRFVNRLRSTLLGKSPPTAATEVFKLASEHWRRLDQEAKDKLDKEYEREMVAYKKKKADYDASLTEAQKLEIKKLETELTIARERRKLKNDIKDAGKPKRPMSSYLLFCQTEKDSIKNLGFIEYQLKMKEKWYSLPKQEKDKWEKKAEELKTVYRKELTKWEEKMMKMGNVDFVRNAAAAAFKKSTKKQPSA